MSKQSSKKVQISMINYNKRRFRYTANSQNGEGSSETLFLYFQEGDVVWGTYSGGRIRFGNLLAKVNSEGILDMRYQQINQAGEFNSGLCRTVPEVLSTGLLRLHEHWQWTTGDLSHGTSIVEECPHEESF